MTLQHFEPRFAACLLYTDFATWFTRRVLSSLNKLIPEGNFPCSTPSLVPATSVPHLPCGGLSCSQGGLLSEFGKARLICCGGMATNLNFIGGHHESIRR
jgi:hypothetical protein